MAAGTRGTGQGMTDMSSGPLDEAAEDVVREATGDPAGDEDKTDPEASTVDSGGGPNKKDLPEDG
jgi:hypothetical protein